VSSGQMTGCIARDCHYEKEGRAPAFDTFEVKMGKIIELECIMRRSQDRSSWYVV
jgi:hypothetical protein